MIYEYCHLGSLKDIIKCTEEKFDEPEIASLSYNILSGLDFCHRKKRVILIILQLILFLLFFNLFL